MDLRPYRKAIAAAAVPVLVAVLELFGVDVTDSEAALIVAAVLEVVGVFTVRNEQA